MRTTRQRQSFVVILLTAAVALPCQLAVARDDSGKNKIAVT